MWLRQLTDYLLTHRFQAVLVTFTITLLPFLLAFYLPFVGNNLKFFLPISTIGILIAAFMTLVQGPAKGGLFTLAATLPLIILFFLAGGYGHGMVNPVLLAFVGFGMLSNILIWFFAVMLFRGTTWSNVLQIAALFGVLVVSVIHLVYPHIGDWWRQLLAMDTQGNTLSTVALQNSLAQGQLPPKIIAVFSQILTGLIVVAILSAVMIQLIVARWWQSFMFKPGSLRFELHNLRLSKLAGGLFLLCLFLFALKYNRVVPDIFPIIYTLFLAAGLSLIHYFVGMKSSPLAYAFLVILYILLLFLPVIILFLVILGLLDIWMDLRNKFKLT